MKLNHIYQGHTLEVLKTFPNECVDTIITSPPYWGLRDYGDETRVIWDGDSGCKHDFSIKHRRSNEKSGGHGPKSVIGCAKAQDDARFGQPSITCSKCSAWYGQLGLEPTLDLYIRHLLQITAELKRVLKPTGVMFWNHGDCYSGGGQGGKGIRGLQVSECGFDKIEISNIPAKCLALQNYRLIIKMIDEQGWILRNSIVWNKPNHMPSSIKDRFANAYEPVFMLVKSKKYWFDLDAVREPYAQATIDRCDGTDVTTSNLARPVAFKRIMAIGGKNPGDVWTIPTQPFPEAHFATFPEKLVAPMIKCACPEWICKKCGKARIRIIEKGKLRNPDNMQNINKDERNLSERGWNREAGFSPNCYREIKTIGWTDCKCSAGWNQGIVLDPFMGSGTVAKVARKLHRKHTGIEISGKYIEFYKKRLAQGVFEI